MSDYRGAALMVDALPRAEALLGDKGYDADWFRSTLADRGIAPCIPSKANRKVAIPHDRILYRQRHKIENMFGRLKDWRRIHPSAAFQRCFASSEPFGCFRPLRPMRPHLHVRHLHRRDRHPSGSINEF